ncbi:MAG TPA: MBL fold metallo-hydrolase [Allosphingosinicella sp.]|jgi:L-ascorbate metabolism protein UlaG (beta-lactamase superfamily)|nr:MBL fold metallo-hydrolase [Allosphingosinicella sp.]
MRTWLRRLGTTLLFLAVALCLAPSLIPPFLDRVYYEGPRSDHFDGERFFNPTPGPRSAAHGGPARFINRFIGSNERARWPERVEVAPTVPPRRVEGTGMLVTWIGHATVLVQTAGLNILTDPIWSERASPFAFVGPRRVRAPGVRFEDLPRIDLVLVSHNHYDHLDLPTLKRLWARDRPVIVTSIGNDTILRRAGIPARNAVTDCGRCPGVEALDWGSSTLAEGEAMAAWKMTAAGPAPIAQVQVLRNHHWGSRWGTDRNRALWSAFAVRIPGGSFFFAGDTGWGDGSWVAEAARHGPYRLAILPVGAYEPRDVMQPNHLDPDEAVRAFELLKPAVALGMHWGTFQLTFESIDDPPRRLAAALKARGIAPARFVTTEAGRSFSLP